MPSQRLAPSQALALGLMQGPTELLPVSSSAHTALIPWLAGWSYAELDPQLRKSFEVALHVGAGVALAIEMREELAETVRRLDRGQAAVIALALAPPAFAGFWLQRFIERRLGGPRSIAAGLIAGAVAMALVELRPPGPDGRAREARGRADAGPGDGLALGLAQALALIPGVSRSGATLVAARARGFSRADAETLSWQAALPVILGASTLKGAQLASTPTPAGVRRALLAGGGAALLSTLGSARLRRHHAAGRSPGGRSLLPYALYRCLLAALVIARLRERPLRAGRGRG